jgi:predicted transcriptional regulator
MILNGLKKVELRSGRLGFHWTSTLWLYASSPQKALLGTAGILFVAYGCTGVITSTFRHYHGLSDADVESLFELHKFSDLSAIMLTNVERLPQPIPLADLRAAIPEFVVPQSYRYLRQEEELTLKRLIKTAGHEDEQDSGHPRSHPGRC